MDARRQVLDQIRLRFGHVEFDGLNAFSVGRRSRVRLCAVGLHRLRSRFVQIEPDGREVVGIVLEASAQWRGLLLEAEETRVRRVVVELRIVQE